LHHASAKRLRPFLLVALAALSAPGAAHAHRLTTVAVDYRMRVLTAAHGVSASTLDGGRKLELSASPNEDVLVLGYEHEPFLRFTRQGVEARLSSPTAQSLGLSSGGRGWKRVSSGHSFAWADQRLLPGSGYRKTHWSIPVNQGDVRGVSWREPAPVVWPWILGGAALFAGAVILLVCGRRRAAALVLATLAGAAITATLTGLALAGIGSAPSHWLQVAAVAAVAAGGIALATWKQGLAAVTLGIVAIVAALEGVAQLGIYRHPVVLSALPGNAARALVAVALACGLAVVGFSVLEVEPRSGR
jgi:hypothetical protein